MLKHSNLFDKISKYLLAATLVIVPLFPKFPLIQVSGTYVAIRFEDILLLLLAILVFIKLLPKLRLVFKDEIFSSLGIFFLVGFTSVVSAALVTNTIDPKIGLLHLFRRIEYVVPFVAVISLLDGKKVSENIHFFIKLLLIVTFVTFLYGLGQRYLNFPIIITQNEEYSKGVALFWTPGSHINASFAGHYDLAAVMVLFLSVFITLLVLLKDKVSQLMLLMATGAGFWLLINSVSRIAQVSYLVAIGVSLFLARKFKAMAVVFVVSIVLISTSSNLLSRFGRIFEVYFGKLNNLSQKIESSLTVSAADIVLPEKRTAAPLPSATPVQIFEDRSTSIRLNVEWPRAIRAFSKNPILGTGYSSINLATDNDYLRILGETGLLGFLAFFLVFARIAKVFVGILSEKLPTVERGFVVAVTGGLVGTFLTAFFIDVFEASKFAIIFWFLIGLVVYTSRNTKYVQNK